MPCKRIEVVGLVGSDSIGRGRPECGIAVLRFDAGAGRDEGLREESNGQT